MKFIEQKLNFVNDLKGLITLSEEEKLKNYILVCLETKERTVEKIKMLPWKKFLTLLWSGALG